MLTDGNAYRSGRFFDYIDFKPSGIPVNGFGDPDKDVRFEMEYSYTVAEPGPAVLVFLGLMLLLTRATYRFRQVKRLFR